MCTVCEHEEEKQLIYPLYIIDKLYAFFNILYGTLIDADNIQQKWLQNVHHITVFMPNSCPPVIDKLYAFFNILYSTLINADNIQQRWLQKCSSHNSFHAK